MAGGGPTCRESRLQGVSGAPPGARLAGMAAHRGLTLSQQVPERGWVDNYRLVNASTILSPACRCRLVSSESLVTFVTWHFSP